MTKEETRPSERPEGRCRWGSQSPNPCPREATTWLEPEELVYPVCDEHARARRYALKEEELFGSLQTLSGWINGLDEYDRFGAIGTVAMRGRDELLKQYGDAAVKFRAAKLIADQGPLSEDETALTFDKAEGFARLMIQADGLNNARAIIEDAPEELVSRHNRWEIAAALDAAHTATHAEVERCRAKEDPPDVLTTVNQLLSEASDLLDESHALGEEEDEAERRISHFIAKAGGVLTSEQRRRRREGEAKPE